MSKLNVVSLFDGARIGYSALIQAGHTVDNYYASEICENAIAVANDNFPNVLNLGDVTKWRDWEIDWATVDLLIGGSPCQGFSICGKQLAFADPRSALILEYIELLAHIKKVNPNIKFFLENVKMSDANMQTINGLLGVEAMFIDSKVVCAQMRKRYYWFNWECAQPVDRGITFQSILDDGYVAKQKSWCMLESWNRFPKQEFSVKKRYQRSMMPVIFTSPDFDWSKGWREPSITECEKLMGLPVGYTKAIPAQKAKGVLGNGWQRDTVTHIFKALP